jgi:transcriptional regulator with XRE-family HTH domain
MPKSKLERPKHILRRVREAVGVSRNKLAILTGFSAVYLKKIESGVTPMTKTLALLVTVATGANYFQLLTDDGSAPKDQTDRPLTPASREAARTYVAELSEAAVDEYVEQLHNNIEDLLEAAALAPDARFLNIARTIRQALEDIALQFDMEALCQRVLDDYGTKPQGSKFFAPHPKGKREAIQKARTHRWAARAELLKAKSAKTPSLPVPAPDLNNGAETSAAIPRARAGGRYRQRS